MTPPRSGDATPLVVALGLVVLLLAVVDAAVAYVPSTWIQRDGRFYTNTNVTLAERGSVDQSEWAASWYERDLGWNRTLDAAWSNVAQGRHGNRVPKHPILMPVLSTPLYWAFGLRGLLLFNLLAFAAAGAAAFAFARRYASPTAALIAAGAFLLATGVRTHVYDYHVDVLLLALWLGGLAALHARRGLAAGVLVAGALMLKPTTILLVPAAALLGRPDRKTFGWAIAGGAGALAFWAMKNWVVFGQPWWAGYNRMLVVEDGRAVLAEIDAFSVPLREGLQNLWAGPYGLRHRMPLALGGLVGLLLLARRRPLAVLAVFGTVAAAVGLFATYLWYGDRFLWPALALAIPGLALLVDAPTRWVPRHRDLARVALATLLVGAVRLGAHHRELLAEPRAWLGLVLLAALATALTQAARRSAPRAAPLAAVVLLFFPGVLERALDPGVDLVFAFFVVAALASRGARWALLFTGLAGVAFFVLGPAEPAVPAPLAFAGPSRGAAVLLGAALIAVPFLGRQAALLLPLLLLAWDPVRALGAPLPLYALAVATLALPGPLERLGGALVDAWRVAPIARRALYVLTPLVALFVTGLVPRLDPPPFRAASERGVRSATVKLDHIPCDFLAWEHFNWECATFDRGVHGEVGLITSAPLEVGGQSAPMLFVSAPGGRTRTVRWEGLEPAGDDTELVLETAVPDDARGGGTLTVILDGETLEAIALPMRPDGRVETHRYRIPFPIAAGPMDLELRFEARGSSVLVDAWFE